MLDIFSPWLFTFIFESGSFTENERHQLLVLNGQRALDPYLFHDPSFPRLRLSVGTTIPGILCAFWGYELSLLCLLASTLPIEPSSPAVDT